MISVRTRTIISNKGELQFEFKKRQLRENHQLRAAVGEWRVHIVLVRKCELIPAAPSCNRLLGVMSVNRN
jgi:ribosomal protein L9